MYCDASAAGGCVCHETLLLETPRASLDGCGCSLWLCARAYPFVLGRCGVLLVSVIVCQPLVYTGTSSDNYVILFLIVFRLRFCLFILQANLTVFSLLLLS